MVIDVHLHMTSPGFTRGSFVRGNARAAASMLSLINKTNITASDYIEMLKKTVDPTGSKMLEMMDKAGVDKAVIFGVDWAYGVTGEPRVSNKEQNRIHAEMAKKYPNRFIALAALDPRRPDFMEQAKQCIEEWGMRGFKIMPAAGFYPTDPICFPLYEKCTDWKVPILFHSGGGEFNWQFSQPMYIASVAERYPDVNMVMAHAGNESWQAALAAAQAIPNVYLDLSTWQKVYRINPEEFYQWLRHMIDWTGPWKLLWATDNPMPNFWVPMDQWAEIFRKPTSKTIKFTKEEMDIILGKAAEKVFNFS